MGAVWPHVSKFRHFGKFVKVFGPFLSVYWLFGKMLILLWENFYAFVKIYIVVNGQTFNK